MSSGTVLAFGFKGRTEATGADLEKRVCSKFCQFLDASSKNQHSRAASKY